MITKSKWENKQIIKEKVSAKQFAIMIIDSYLDNAEYWTERYVDEYKEMSGKEIAEVYRQFTNLDIRIRKMLNKAKGV